MLVFPRFIAVLATVVLLTGSILSGCSWLTPAGTDVPGDEPADETSLTASQIKKLAKRVEAMEKLESRLESQELRIASLVARMDRLETSTRDSAWIPGKSESESAPSYTEPMTLYQDARHQLMEKRFVQAATLFETYVATYPDSEFADNAVYWLGECYYSQGNFSKAIETFKSLVRLYPKGSKVPDALLKTAYAYLSLDEKDRAHHYLKILVKTYPFTPAGEKAEEKLKSFQ